MFALNGDIFNPEVKGVDGILNEYCHARKGGLYTFGGPTYFAPFLKKINKYVKYQKQKSSQQ